MGDLGHIGGAGGDAVEELSAKSIGAEGVVDGEEEAVRADDLEGAEEGWIREVAASGDVDVVVEVVGDATLEVLRGGSEDGLRANEREGEVFAHVADDDLEGREAVEEAGDDEAKDVEAGFNVPAPAG